MAARVSRLLPYWNEPAQDYDARFPKAIQLCGDEFTERVRYFTTAWIPARQIVADALMKRKNVDPSGRVLLFEKFAPWKVISNLVF